VAGDLFQFWFDLGSTIPKDTFDVLEALARLRRSGTRVDYLGGNHDWWRSDFFERQLGVHRHGESLALAVQGRRVLVRHGDGVGPGDRGYKLLRRILRARPTIALARALHPDFLLAVARGAGNLSRAHTDRRPPDLGRLESAAEAAFEAGHDALVLGHVHAQVHRRLGRGELVVIGDWLELRSYVRLEGGVFTPGRLGGPGA
jgi:UDP-2,3-diacylglucosamine hydrolase